jgi:cysteine desulfuration protein SufE
MEAPSYMPFSPEFTQLPLETRQERVIEQFSALKDWDAKYDFIMALGKQLPPMPEALKTDANKVQGCQSQVWMHAFLEEGNIRFYGDSDALIVRGLVALLLTMYDNLPPTTVVASEFGFMQSIQLGNHLSMTRRNGLASMVKQMKLYALAFSMLK